MHFAQFSRKARMEKRNETGEKMQGSKPQQGM
jgi:hypothetical protein